MQNNVINPKLNTLPKKTNTPVNSCIACISVMLFLFPTTLSVG